MTKGMFTSNSDNWATPREFFDALDREFHFTLDACALPENAKCEKYFTPDVDGLQQDWGGGSGILQSAVWAYSRSMGAKGVSRKSQTRHRGCHAIARANRYVMVS